MIDFNDAAKSSLSGVLRGLCVHTVTYPFDVIKIHQQSLPYSTKSFRIASDLFAQGGVGAFYRGIPNQWMWMERFYDPLVKTSRDLDYFFNSSKTS
jgi:hypothetical protein